MSKKYILFLSTNIIWGGSEVLWTITARQLAELGYEVKAGLRYDHQLVEAFIPAADDYIDLRSRTRPLSIAQRIIQKAGLRTFSERDLFHETLQKKRPDLVIISQGNNFEGRHLIGDCLKLNIPYVTLTHLVKFDIWPALNDNFINDLRRMYQQAVRNYFVSHNTLHLHEKLLGEQLTNGSVVYNPFVARIPAGLTFPPVVGTVYKIALVGRIECYHKGYDLLIEVLKADKWKRRPVEFTVFGNGPHVALLQRMMEMHAIHNIHLHDHVDDIAQIWKEHHILLMPSRMEGQSLSLIEAMRFGRAAIVTDVGGTAELVEDNFNGFMAAFPEPACIDEAMERAWTRKEEWEQMGINARNTIEQKHPADAVTFFTKQIQEALRETHLSPIKNNSAC
ncbi:glycosyltransferase family 4 protein [Ferruginibacter paludis]|uniref:glycosyltransferase family 4 protein n=1 Tax=Ferruginibacter paludis TaxID=1310417 RepID=UPI0025B33DD9|nr:glycosyltransferase family 4 protein [Ferruginibacter paludis]MDN3656724.1 glycosyltransferase family 4 protein [Ferruginibacter paludis]